MPVTPRLLMADFRRLIAIAIIRPELQHGNAARFIKGQDRNFSSEQGEAFITVHCQ